MKGRVASISSGKGRCAPTWTLLVIAAALALASIVNGQTSGSGMDCNAGCYNGGTCAGPDMCSCATPFSGSYCQNRWPAVTDLGCRMLTSTQLSANTQVTSNFPLTGSPTVHAGYCAYLCYQQSLSVAILTRDTSNMVQCYCRDSLANVGGTTPSSGTCGAQCPSNTADVFYCGSSAGLAQTYQLNPLPIYQVTLMASDSVRTGSTFVAGATITFTCGLPQGGPASVTYKWYFGTMEITSATSSTYQIPQPAAPTDVGMYRCDVTDGATLPISSNYTFAGSKNASLSLTIQTPPGAQIAGNAMRTVSQYTPIALVCTSTGSGSANFSWQRSSGVAFTNGGAYTINGGMLTVNSAQQSRDSIEFICVATDNTIVDPNQRTSSATVSVTVMNVDECALPAGQPNADNCNTNAMCTDNTTGTFTCQCNTGYMGDGVTCNPICDPPCFNGGTCSMPNTCSCTNTYSGTYCQNEWPAVAARDCRMLTTIQLAANTQVTSNFPLTGSPTVHAGYCAYQCYQQSLSVAILTRDTSNMVQCYCRNSLTAVGGTTPSSGTCGAQCPSNTADVFYCGSSAGLVQTYQLNPLPIIEVTLQAFDSVRGGSTFVAGATITFTCSLPQGIPSSVTYKWYFASTEISGALSSTYTETNVMPARSGMYRCEVTDTPPTSANYTFAATRSASLSITIQTPPAASVSTAPSTVTQFAAFTLTCTSSGTATFSWQNSAGMAITSGGPYTITAGVLRVNSAQIPRDNIEFVCVATDNGIVDPSQRTSSATVSILVQNVDECAIPAGQPNADNCNTNAMCTDTTGSFTCQCNTGYTGNGVTCSPICDPPCFNGGTCSMPNTCSCPTKYSGTYCQNEWPAVAAPAQGCRMLTTTQLSANTQVTSSFPLTGSPTVHAGYCAYQCYQQSLSVAILTRGSSNMVQCYCRDSLANVGGTPQSSGTCGAQCPSNTADVFYCGSSAGLAQTYQLNPLPIIQVTLQATDSVRTGMTFVAGATIDFTCGVPQGRSTSVTYKWSLGSSEISGAVSSTYQVANVMNSNAGMYTCMVTDGTTLPTSANYTFAGSKSASISITIQTPPTASINPTAVDVRDGTDTMLTCSSTGTGTPSYTWQDKSGTAITTGGSYTVNGGMLSINNVEYSRDHGTITCVATISTIVDPTMRTSTATATINVQTPVSFTNGPIVQISEHQFGSAVLTLSFNSNVNPIPLASGITWRDPSNTIVVASARHALSMNNAVLTITRADVTDDGLYTATVTNGIIGPVMISFNVTIFIAPETYFNIPNNAPLDVRQYTRVSFTCTSIGNPTPTITWEKDGGSLPPYVQTALSAGTPNGTRTAVVSTLTIANVTYMALGIYTCNGSFVRNNQRSTASESVTLNVQVTPTQLFNSPRYLFVYEGSSFAINCSVFANPAPTISFGSNPMITTPPTLMQSSRAPFYENIYTLASAPVQGTDRVYTITCTASSSEGVSSSNTMVSVWAMPAAVSAGDVVANVSGANIALTCVFRGITLPTVAWTKMGGGAVGGTTNTVGLPTPYQVRSTLTFTTLAKANEGRYTCTATNSNGTASQQVQLTVQVPPSASAANGNLVGVEGTSLVLTVTVQNIGDPAVIPAAIIWNKDGNTSWTPTSADHSLSSGNLVLTIPSVMFYDAGTYTITLTNAAGVATVTFVVTYQEPPAILTPPANVRVNEGGTVSFTCVARGNPRPTFTWMRNTTTLSSQITTTPVTNLAGVNQRGSLAVTSTLNIPSSQFNGDQGTYTCTASNTHGNAPASPATLKVFVLPAFASQTMSVMSSMTATATFTCDVTGIPTPSIKWFKGSSELTTTTRRTFTAVTNRVMTITNLMYSDRGMYQCKVDNRDGSVGGAADGNMASLAVYVSPTITNGVAATQTIEKGNDATFSCSASGFPAPTFSWTHNSNALPTKATVAASTTTTAGSSSTPAVLTSMLTIPNLEFADAGVYECTSMVSKSGFVGGTSLSDTAKSSGNLVVNVQPLFYNPIMRSVDVMENSSFTLTCQAFAHPLPAITWLSMPTIDATPSITVNSLMNSTSMYRIGRVAAQGNTFQYTVTCRAANSVGSNTATTTVTITIAPELQNSTGNITSNANQVNVALACIYRGQPEPSVSWSKVGGSNMGIAMRTAETSLTFRSTLSFATVRKSDEGFYYCNATNTHGTSNKLLYLRVQELPVAVAARSRSIGVNGSPLTIAVNVTYPGDPAYPLMNVTWSKDGTTIVTSARIILSADRLSLSITTIQPGDDGIYTVVISNAAGSITVQLSIAHQEAPVISTAPSNVRVNQGSTATFTCEATGDPRPTLMWTVNGTAVPQSMYTSENITLPGATSRGIFARRSVLTIPSVTNMANQGTYRCIASNIHLPNDMRVATLEVFVPVTVASQPANVMSSESATASFSCNLNGIPAPTITWFKGTTAITSGGRISIASPTRTSQTLSITNLQFSDRGMYRCQGDNRDSADMALGGMVTGNFASLSVYVAPRITTPPVTTMTLTESSNAVFTCLSYGFPTPSITWQLNSGSIPATATISNVTSTAESSGTPATLTSTLTVRSVTFSVRGTYTCTSMVSKTGFVGGSALADTTSASGTLEVNVAPRIQDALFRQQSVDETKSFIVNCTVFNNPASNIAFTSSPAITASPSVSSSGLIPYSGAVYTIAAAPVQGFSYIYNITCTATNTLASASAVTQVTVNVAPRFQVAAKRYINVFENSSYTINCTVFAHPQPTLTQTSVPAIPSATNAMVSSRPFYSNMYTVSRAPVLATPIYTVTCASNNNIGSVGSVSVTTQVTVNVRPEFQAAPNGFTVTSNDMQSTAALSCVFRGYEEPTISWTKAGGGVVRGTTTKATESAAHVYRSTLTFTAVQKTDEGNYTCTATNPNGTDSRQVRLRVQVEPQASALFETQVGVDTQPLNLTVVVANYGDPPVPTTNITWSKVGNSSWTPFSADHTLSADRLTLAIPSIHHADDGMYTVHLGNLFGPIYVNFTITHEEPPVIITAPANVFIDETETATFTCVARADPAPVIYWIHNSTNVSSLLFVNSVHSSSSISARKSFATTSTLTIPGATNQANQGNYTCIAANIYQPDARATASLSVYVPSIQLAPPASVNSSETQLVTFRCQLFGIPRPAISWFHGTMTLVNGSYGNRVTITNNGEVLTINRLEFSDRGSYSCTGDNRDVALGTGGLVTGTPATLRVYISPRITVPPNTPNTLNETYNLFLRCTSYGYPQPVITWQHNMNSALPSGSTVTPVLIAPENSSLPAIYTSTLIVPNVNFTERGQYACTSSVSKMGFVGGSSLPDSISRNASVEVQLRPRLQSLSSNARVTYPGRIVFTCTFSGNPTPSIVVTAPSFDSNSLPARATIVPTSGTLIQDGGIPFSAIQLTISPSTRADNGTYSCSATTPVATVSYSSEVVVLEVPDAPPQPTATNIMANQLTINWQEPVTNNEPITSYEIRYHYTNCYNTMITNVSMATPSNRSIVLFVEPYQIYTITVRASNSIGTGSYSRALAVQAMTFRPEAAPLNVNVTSNSASSVLVAWDPIPCTERNGLISQYTVNCTITREDRDDVIINNMTTGTVSGDNMSFIVNNLDAYSIYVCDVTGSTSAGMGPASRNNSARTGTAPSLPPLNIKVGTGTQTNTLQVEWAMPADTNGILTGYVVSYETASLQTGIPFFNTLNSTSNGTLFEGSVAVAANTYSVLLDELLNYTEYNITVEAENSAGLSLPSQSGSALTPENVPGAPLDVTVTSSSQYWTFVAWNAPNTPYGILTGYQLSISGMSRNNPNATFVRRDINYSENTTEANVTMISAGFNYTITVRARTSVGLGAPAIALARTDAGTPAPVTGSTVNIREAAILGTAETILNFEVSELSGEAGNIFAYQVFVLHLGIASGAVSYPEGSPNEIYALGSKNILNASDVAVQNGPAMPPSAYVAMEFNPSVFAGGNRITVAIGNESVTRNEFRSYSNVKLRPNHVYTVFLRGYIDSNSRRKRATAGSLTERQKYGLYTTSDYAPVQSTQDEVSNAGAIAGAIIGVLIAGCLVVLLVYYWRRTQSKGLISDNETGGVWTAEQAETSLAAKKRRSTMRLTRVDTQNLEEAAQTRGPLSFSAFTDHVAEMRANDSFLLAKEYEIITKQSPKLAYEVCARPENKAKNRYANIVAYDETRVVLPLLEDDPNSDYINANFLDGYDRPKEYIACQGPVPEGFADFWRMVWENNVREISMLTNLEEKGRLKCHQYWPLSGSVSYGPLTVTLTDTMTLADFVVRTFEIVKKGCSDEEVASGAYKREVKQFHFIVWPDHGVPDHATPLLNFLRRMRAYHARDFKPQSPMVVHCSAGVGRTGTLIVIDAMLNRVREKGDLDVFNYVMQLRTQRNFMVQTEAQYVFLHDALIEALNCGNTEINAMNLRQYISDLEKNAEGESCTNLELQFKRLSSGSTGNMHYRAAGAPVNKKKNRLANTLPYDSSRVKLTQLPGVEGSDYINASYIDGFSKARTYIATQGPMQDTLNDFWTMIWEKEVTSVVMLSKLRENNSEHSAEYWPKTDTQPLTFGKYLVKLESEHTAADIITRTISVTNTQENQTRTIHQFQYVAWPERGVPDNGAAILDLIGQVQRHQMSTGDKPVVVHCSNGVGRTGIFCAVSTVIERVKLDSMIDVFQTVKLMRMQRVSIVQNAEQYLFVYRTVLEYLDSFDNYANFK